MLRHIADTIRPIQDTVLLVKILTGMLSTNSSYVRKPSTDVGKLCSLCGHSTGCEETNWHVLWQCEASALVKARRRLSEKLKALMRCSGIRGEDNVVMAALWRLGDTGASEWDTLDGMMALLPLDQVSDVTTSLLRSDREALGGSALSWAQKGVPGRRFAQALQDLGLSEERADALLCSIADLVQGEYGLGAVWKAFATEKKERRKIRGHGIQRMETLRTLQERLSRTGVLDELDAREDRNF